MMMVRKSKGLGERHQKILGFIQEYQNKHKHPPSIREIGEYCDISSTSVVNYYLDQLEKSGHIERDRKISRGLRLSNATVNSDMLRIPILGPIAAGIPLPELQPGVSYMTDNEDPCGGYCPQYVSFQRKRQRSLRPRSKGRFHDRCHDQ